MMHSPDKGQDKPRETMIDIDIIGQVVEISNAGVTFDWFGGSSGLKATAQQMTGDWENIAAGDWFEAKMVRALDGVLVSLEFRSRSAPLEALTQEELTQSYNSLAVAKLDSVE
jgi:hypothetical protein